MFVAIKNKREMKYIKSEDLQVGEVTLKDLHNAVTKQQEVLIGLLEQSQQAYKDEKEKYNSLISFLSDYLLDKTNNTYEEEKSIREQITSLMVANTEPLDSLSFENGYISGIEQTNLLVRPIETPEDVTYGYWKYIDGKYKLDEERFKQLWSVI